MPQHSRVWTQAVGGKTPIAAEELVLKTIPGNLYLSLAGEKTLHVGLPTEVQTGQLVWLSADYAGKSMELPIIIDEQKPNAPRAKMTLEERRQAGFSATQSITERLAEDKTYTAFIERATHESGSPSLSNPSLFEQTAPASRIRYHLATPEEILARGGDLAKANEAVHAAAEALKTAQQSKEKTITDACNALATYNVNGQDLSNAIEQTIQNFGPTRKDIELRTMPGNTYLSLAGVKTLYTGMPANVRKNDLVHLAANLDGQTIRIPVVIDQRGKEAPRSSLTQEERNQAGYGLDGLQQRLSLDPAYTRFLEHATHEAGLVSPTADEKLFMQTAPAARISYHLATPAEIQRSGGDVEAELANLETVTRLLRKANLQGEKTIGDAKQFASSIGHNEATLAGKVQTLVTDYQQAATILAGLAV